MTYVLTTAATTTTKNPTMAAMLRLDYEEARSWGYDS